MSKLEEMLRYVSEHNDFYKNRIKEYGIKDPLDITQWPILTRKELQENRYNMFSDGYKSKYFYQNLRRQSSSGATGVPVSVYWDDRDYYLSIRTIWKKRLHYNGIRPNDNQVVFGLSSPSMIDDGVRYVTDPKNVLNFNINSVRNDNECIVVLDLIDSFRPTWMYIRPYVLNKLINMYAITGRTPPSSLKYIESVSEILTHELRQKATDFFRVPIANMYGSEEMNGIAYELPGDVMRVFEDNVYAECLCKDENICRSGHGDLIVTNLYNRAMPLIRYAQGDTVSLDFISNDGFSMSQVVSTVSGRTLDNICVNGCTINAIILLEIMSEVNNIYNSILAYYHFVFYKETLECLFYIELEKNRIEWYTSVELTIEKVFDDKVPKYTGIKAKVLLESNRGPLNKKHRLLEIK